MASRVLVSLQSAERIRPTGNERVLSLNSKVLTGICVTEIDWPVKLLTFGGMQVSVVHAAQWFFFF
jgi:hypothetical protein